MNYHFDEVIDRRNTNSLKYDFAAEHGKPADLLPMWVADMDFRVAPEITMALEGAVRHGIYGYSDAKGEYFEAVRGWFSSRFGWNPQKEWMVKTPGVVFALATAIRAFTQPGDSVLIQQPVCHPFASCVVKNGRKLVNCPLVYEDGAYHIDFEEFERTLALEEVKLFLLCSPHNPIGRVWTREELTRLGDLCDDYGVLVVSDEIHADFVYEGHRHTVFGSLGAEYLRNSIICTAPSKTFNLAGLQTSNIFIADPALRCEFKEELARTGYEELNALGLVACQAAYANGAPWLDALRGYLAGNLSLAYDFIRERLPGVRLVEPEGTYLLWVDFRGLGLSDRQLEDLIVNRAKLWLDAGSMFGPEGTGFQRFNIACPRATLEQALTQLEQAIQSL